MFGLMWCIKFEKQLFSLRPVLFMNGQFILTAIIKSLYYYTEVLKIEQHSFVLKLDIMSPMREWDKGNT